MPQETDPTVFSDPLSAPLPLPRLVRRVRGDARLEALNRQQKVRLHLWLEEFNLTYVQVSEMLEREFGVVVSKSAVATYWQRHCAPAEHDGQLAAATALARLPLAAFSGATLNRARLLAYNLLVRPDPEIPAAARLLEIIRRADQQEISRERLALEKERVALRREELAARPPRTPRSTLDPIRQTPLPEPADRDEAPRRRVAPPTENGEPGSAMDRRADGMGAQILRTSGATRIRLLTRHPRKVVGLDGFGVESVEQSEPAPFGCRIAEIKKIVGAHARTPTTRHGETSGELQVVLRGKQPRDARGLLSVANDAHFREARPFREQVARRSREAKLL